jgi:hypothetical protein
MEMGMRMMRWAVPACLGLWAGCSAGGHVPSDRETRETASSFFCDTAKAREAVLGVLAAWGAPLRQDGPTLVRTRRIREGGVSWRLNAELNESNGCVSVMTWMEIHRHGEFEFSLSESALEEYLQAQIEAHSRRGTGTRELLLEALQRCIATREARRNGDAVEWLPHVSFRQTLFHQMLNMILQAP